MTKLAPYSKAITAAISSGLIALLAALAPESAGGGAVTAAEWVTVVLASLGPGAATWASPANAATGQHRRD